jgi:very-short-patch-repair endonuclease
MTNSMLEKTPPQPLPTRGRGSPAPSRRLHSCHRHACGQPKLHHQKKLKGAKLSRHGLSPLVGEMAGRPEGDYAASTTSGSVCLMPHSNIDPKTRTRARTLRRELTRAEREMWDLLRDFRPRGARFRRETPVGPYIADFAWLSARIIVEVDGDSHETDAGRKHDARRDRFLSLQGFKVLRFDNSDVSASPDAIAIMLERELAPFLMQEPTP